jgi:hypothetical protein
MSDERASIVSAMEVPMLDGQTLSQRAQAIGAGNPPSREMRLKISHLATQSCSSTHSTSCTTLPLTSLAGTSRRGYSSEASEM